MHAMCDVYESWEQKYDMYFILLREEILICSVLVDVWFWALVKDEIRRKKKNHDSLI